jgi:hypothetical protein
VVNFLIKPDCLVCQIGLPGFGSSNSTVSFIKFQNRLFTPLGDIKGHSVLFRLVTPPLQPGVVEIYLVRGVWFTKIRFKIYLRVCGSDFSNVQNILFALDENIIHQHSKPEDPSLESNPHRFRLPTNNPHRHHWKEEAVLHLHIGDSRSKA